MNTVFTYPFLALFLLIQDSIFAQGSIQTIDKELTKIYQKSSFPGFAVGIIKKDSVVLSKGYGYANRKKRIPFTDNTVMPIGSVSKTFIGFALVKAIELNYFTAETPVNDILPFKIINPHQPADTLRIKHLFTHTSGIVDDEDAYLQTYQPGKTVTISLGDFLQSYLSREGKLYKNSNFDSVITGKKYNYSNIASALAAYLIETKSGISFDKFTETYLFQPLNLESTHWFYDEQKAKNYATLYEINVPRLPFYKNLVGDDKSLKTYSSVTYPDGSLKTCLLDLTKYVREMIKGYNHKSNLLRQDYYQYLFNKQFEENNFPENMEKNAFNQAVFWQYNKKDRLAHTGSDPGIFTAVSIDFKTNIGRIVLINANIDTHHNEKIISSLRQLSEALEKVE